MGTASIQSLELGCCTRKPEPGGLAGVAAANAAGGPAAGAPADAAGAAAEATGTCGSVGAHCALSGGGLTGPAPGMLGTGSRMDCEELESMVIAEPVGAPLPAGSALSQDLTCRRAPL